MNNTDKKTVKTKDNKKRLLEALETSLGIVTSACKICNLDRVTFYNYYNKDEKFKLAVDNINEQTIDFVENCLFKQIKSGDTTATIFYLKTKGRTRGYQEIKDYNLNIDEQKKKIAALFPTQEEMDELNETS